MMEETPLVPCVGFRKTLDLDPKRMADYILDNYNELQTISKEQSHTRYEDRTFPKPYDPVLIEFMDQCQEAIHTIPFVRSSRAEIPWTIVHFKHMCTYPHIHVPKEGLRTRNKSTWAVTYWAKHASGNGDLQIWPFGLEDINAMNISPKAGDLFVFPGWLLHGVKANQSEEPRISVSFNCHIEFSTHPWFI